MVFKEEFIIKIAILAEKFADDLQWYVNVMIELIHTSGDFVSDDIVNRLIQIITGFNQSPNIALQRYAVSKLYK